LLSQICIGSRSHFILGRRSVACVCLLH
jgi:hypothetical protein